MELLKISNTITYLYKQQNRNFTYLIRVASTSNDTATAKKRKIAATAEDVDSKESLWMQEKEFRRKEHQWNEVLYNLKREKLQLEIRLLSRQLQGSQVSTEKR